MLDEARAVDAEAVGTGEMLGEGLSVDVVGAIGSRSRVAVEEGIVMQEKVNFLHFCGASDMIIVINHLWHNARQNLDPCLTRAEMHHCYDVPAAACIDELLMLFGCAAELDSEVTAVSGIDTVHYRHEDGAVSRSVFEAVVKDEVMDHLVDDGVFDHLLRKVDARVDAQPEVAVNFTAVGIARHF